MNKQTKEQTNEQTIVRQIQRESVLIGKNHYSMWRVWLNPSSVPRTEPRNSLSNPSKPTLPQTHRVFHSELIRELAHPPETSKAFWRFEDKSPRYSTWSQGHCKPVKCRQPHRDDVEKTRSCKTSLTVPIFKSCFIIVSLFWTPLLWQEGSCCGEWCVLSQPAPDLWVPETSNLSSCSPRCQVAQEKMGASVPHCSSHAYLTYSWEGLALLGTKGKRRSWITTPLMTFSCSIMGQKGLLPSVIL